MDYLIIFIYFIFIVKIIFISLSFIHLYLKVKKEDNTNFAKKIDEWKENMATLFTILMSILIIYLFYPRKQNAIIINTRLKVILFLFGIFLFITNVWRKILVNQPWFINLVKKIGMD